MNPVSLNLPADSSILLWLIDLDAKECLGRTDEYGRLLSPMERARASRFRFERDARRYLTSHAALRLILARQTGMSAKALRFVQGAFGKPRLHEPPLLHFNMSHSGGWALIGVSPVAPIGVDIELMRPMSDLEALAKQNFNPEEYTALLEIGREQQLQTFLQCWTRKEACLKALGSGLSIEPKLFHAGIDRRIANTTIAVNQQPCSMTVFPIDLPGPGIAACAHLLSESAHLAI